MIKYKFNIKKVVQIIYHLLKTNSNKMNYTKLLKILYIADKEFLKLSNFTITGDTPYSMKNGPILSKIKNLINGNFIMSNNQIYWDSYFLKDGYDLSLKNNKTNDDLLCEAEIEILDKISCKYKKKTYNEMINITHDKSEFPEIEWEKAGDSSLQLPFEKILLSLGKTQKEIEDIEKEIKIYNEEEELISCK